MIIEDKFTLRVYFQAMTGLLGEPRNFFAELPDDIRLKVPMCFLIVSSLFFSIASLLATSLDKFYLSGIIYFVNAFGMTLIAALVGYIVTNMLTTKRLSFVRIFSVYAFAAGVTLLASWIPTFFFITEPWKWLLICTGLVKTCGLSWLRAFFIICLSIAIVVLFFYSLLPFFVK